MRIMRGTGPRRGGGGKGRGSRQLAEQGAGGDHDRAVDGEAVGRLEGQIHDKLECVRRFDLRLKVGK